MCKSKAWLILGAIVSFFIALPFDNRIVSFFAGHRLPPLDILFTIITHIGTFIAVFFIISSLFMWHQHKREWIMPFWLGLGMAAVLSYLIKLFSMRPRPAVALGITAIAAVSSYSFPSGHAAASFSALPVLDKEYKRVRQVWITLAVLIAFSRLYLGVHYPSDIIAGALLGYFCGWLAIAVKDKGWFKRLNIFANKKWTR